jgi:hypothetical protein
VPVERRTDNVERARVDHALETAATQAARHAARRTASRAAGGYFLLLFVLLVGSVLYQQSTNTRLNDSELRACERVQNQRERANVSEARQYLLLRAIAESPRASKTIKDEYTVLYRTTLYDPPTDCRSAVGHPGTYRRPPSIPFYALPKSFPNAVVKAAKDKRPQPTLSR